MKLTHNVPTRALLAKTSEPEPISERYQRELDAARRKAERAWKSAERRLRRAEEQASRQPDVPLLAKRDRLRLEVLARLAELREVEELMKSAVGGANWSGRGSVRAVKKGTVL